MSESSNSHINIPNKLNLNPVPVPVPVPQVKNIIPVPNQNISSKNSKSVKYTINKTNDTISNAKIEPDGFFNYKISIFNYKISIWIILLVLLVLFCVGYFVYKYCYLTNNFISYKKNQSDIKMFYDMSSELSNSSDLSDESDKSSKSSKSSKSVKSNKSSKSVKSLKSNKNL